MNNVLDKLKEERRKLFIKMAKASDKANNQNNELDNVDRSLLLQQVRVFQEYIEILDLRIEHIKHKNIKGIGIEVIEYHEGECQKKILYPGDDMYKEIKQMRELRDNKRYVQNTIDVLGPMVKQDVERLNDMSITIAAKHLKNLNEGNE